MQAGAVSRKELPCSQAPCLNLAVFLPPLLQWSLSFGGRECDTDVPSAKEHSLKNDMCYRNSQFRVLAQQASPPCAFVFPDTTLTVKLKFSSLFITLGHGWLWKVPVVQRQVCCKVPLPHYELVGCWDTWGSEGSGPPMQGTWRCLATGLPVLGLREENVVGRECCQGLSGVWGSPIHADTLG